MLNVRVGGIWLGSIPNGAFADVTVTHAWPHGSDEATWRMRPTVSHQVLDRGGSLVEVFNGGIRTWRGHLAEPAAQGQFSANGSWYEAKGVLALDGSGNATNIPDTAVDAAIARGAITWTRPASLSAVSWGTPGEPMKLAELLDQAMAGLGQRCWVDANGAVRGSIDPLGIAFAVPRAAVGRGLTLAEDDYYSHLVGTYLAAGPVYATVTVGDALAATRWGRKEARVDLTGMGIITAGTATTQLTNRLALSGARMGYAESLVVGRGEITTPGGTPAALDAVQAGQLIRLQGVSDRSRPADRPVTDIVLGKSVYTDGAPTTTLTPVGKAARNLTEVIAA